MNLLDAFDSAVRKTPAKAFLRDRGASISYADMQRRSQRAAAVLQAQGVGRGDTVALMCLNTPGFVEALFGAWRLGAALVPVNHKLQAPELQYILDHAQCKALVFDAALAPVVAAAPHPCARLVTEAQEAVPGVQDWDTLVAAARPMEGTRPADGDIAQVLYTSGTTGRPKGCLLSHRAVTLAAITAALGLSITREERTLMAMPIWHSSPLNNWFGGTLYMGGTVVLLREYHPQHFLQAVQDEGVTLYFGAPVSYFAPLQMLPDFARYDLSSVRAWVYGRRPHRRRDGTQAGHGLPQRPLLPGLRHDRDRPHGHHALPRGAGGAGRLHRPRGPARRGHARGARRRRGCRPGRHRRDLAAHRQRDGRATCTTPRPRRPPSRRAAGTARAILRAWTTRAISSSWTGPRTWSSRVARTCIPRRWRTRCRPIPRSPMSPSWAGPTPNGARPSSPTW